jgi:hypothetical protein
MAAGRRRRRHLRRVGVIPFSAAMTPKGTLFCGEIYRCLFMRRKTPGASWGRLLVCTAGHGVAAGLWAAQPH